MGNRSTKQITGGAIISYLAIGVNVLIGLIYTPWMIQTIGSSNYGLYTLAISVINVFAVDFGLSSATTRFVAKQVAENNEQGVRDILGIIAKLYLLVSAAIFCVLVVIYPFLGSIYKGLTAEEFQAFKIVYLIVASYSIISFPFVSLNGIFSAYEEFVAMKLCDLFQKVGSVLLIVVILLLGGDLYALVTVNALCGIVTIIVKLGVLRKKHGLVINWEYRNRSLLKEIFSFSIWTTVVSICTRLIFNLVPSILGMVSNSQAIAQYGVASTIDGYFYTFAAALGSLFLTRVMRLLYGNEKNKDALNKLAVQVGRIQLVIISLLYMGFVAIGKEFIILWMGKEYEITYYCILFLSFPDIIEYAQQIPNSAITAANKIKSQAKAYMFTAAISVIVTFIGAKIAGSLGASVAICIACICRTVTMCYLYVKELDFDLAGFFKKTYPSILPVLIGMLVFSFALNRYWTVRSWIELLGKGLIVVIVYMVLTVIFFLNNDERKLLMSKIARR